MQRNVLFILVYNLTLMTHLPHVLIPIRLHVSPILTYLLLSINAKTILCVFWQFSPPAGNIFEFLSQRTFISSVSQTFLFPPPFQTVVTSHTHPLHHGELQEEYISPLCITDAARLLCFFLLSSTSKHMPSDQTTLHPDSKVTFIFCRFHLRICTFLTFSLLKFLN